jgi:hypothetical protein
MLGQRSQLSNPQVFNWRKIFHYLFSVIIREDVEIWGD